MTYSTNAWQVVNTQIASQRVRRQHEFVRSIHQNKIARPSDFHNCCFASLVNILSRCYLKRRANSSGRKTRRQTFTFRPHIFMLFFRLLELNFKHDWAAKKCLRWTQICIFCFLFRTFLLGNFPPLEYTKILLSRTTFLFVTHKSLYTWRKLTWKNWFFYSKSSKKTMTFKDFHLSHLSNFPNWFWLHN